MDLISISIRTIIFYFIILLAYRIMGKREVGQLGVTDLTVSILIAEIVAISIENFNDTLLLALIPIIILVSLELLFAYLSVKSKKLRDIFDGNPSIIIKNGQINYKEMVKLRYSLDDLLVQLRQNEIKSIDEVEYAFLEPNGKLSIFKYKSNISKKIYPMPLIIDGIVDKKTLKEINKNKKWLDNEVLKYDLKIEDIFYAFSKNNKLYIIKRKDII